MATHSCSPPRLSLFCLVIIPCVRQGMIYRCSGLQRAVCVGCGGLERASPRDSDKLQIP